jgi:hypothetical protein
VLRSLGMALHGYAGGWVSMHVTLCRRRTPQLMFFSCNQNLTRGTPFDLRVRCSGLPEQPEPAT